MKKLAVFLIVSLSAAFGFEGPEFMILGRDYLDEITFDDSLYSTKQTKPVECKFADASLFDIKKLDWYYGRFGVNTALGKFGISFINYGIPDLYERQKYEISYKHRLWTTLCVGADFSRERYHYKGYFRDETNDFLSFNTSYSVKTIGLLVAVSEIPTKRGVKLNSKHAELITAVNWRASDLVALHGIFFKDDMNHTRFDIGQKLSLAEPLAINAGILTGPQTYYLGTILSYKGFAFEYVFYDVTQLPGCWSLALIFR